MKKLISILVFTFLCANYVISQDSRINSLQRVKVPDSIYAKLEEAYKTSTGFDNVNAGRNVWNLLAKKKLIFENGVYTFKGQGPHFPRRLFIFNGDKLYVFTSNYITEVLKQFMECADSLQLSEVDQIKYLKKISNYLEDESEETYGTEVK